MSSSPPPRAMAHPSTDFVPLSPHSLLPSPSHRTITLVHHAGQSALQPHTGLPTYQPPTSSLPLPPYHRVMFWQFRPKLVHSQQHREGPRQARRRRRRFCYLPTARRRRLAQPPRSFIASDYFCRTVNDEVLSHLLFPAPPPR